MPIDPDFAADCPYAPSGLLIDDIVEIDAPNNRVLARMPTSDELPLTREQRAHPVRHPRHVSGGLMVHMTGMVAFVRGRQVARRSAGRGAGAYYVLGLRHADGWVGYGAKIHSVRFRALAPPGDPMLLECTATQMRKTDTSVFARYAFRFTQSDKLIYEADQTALWTRVGVEPAL